MSTATHSAPDAQSLRYTRRDWSRWDSFDLLSHTFVQKRRGHNLGIDEENATEPSASGHSGPTPSPAAERYFRAFRRGFLRDFHSENHRRFRGFKPNQPNHPDDLHATLKRTRELDLDRLMRRVSYGINQQYDLWLASQRARAEREIQAAAQQRGEQVDERELRRQMDMLVDSTPFDARNDPGCADTIQLLSSLLSAHLDLQCLDPQLTACDPAKPALKWRCYGVWPEPDGRFVQRLVFWRAGGVHFAQAHYAHLLDDNLLRRIRRSCFASLSAQWEHYRQNGPNAPYHTESQWLQRVSGVCQATFAALRCEQELRTRGVWDQEADSVRRAENTPEPEPTWSNEAMVSLCETMLQEVVDRVSRGGIVEYLSSYHTYSVDLLCAMQLHAPSQRVYEQASALLDRWRFDLLSNFLPASGAASGPSSRSYDMFCGVGNTHDKVDVPLEMRYVFRPHCGELDDEAEEGEESFLRLLMRDCNLSEPPPQLLPASGQLDPSFHRCLHAHSMLAGLEPVPYGMLRDLLLRHPYRLVEQRFAKLRGTERMNVLTPRWQLGHAGEDMWSCPTANYVCARMAGPPVANQPVTDAKRGQGNLPRCTSYLRLFPELCGVGGGDNPFGEGNRVVGGLRLALARQVCVQHQGFLLVSHLLAPRLEHTKQQLQHSVCSNLVLPLNVDAIMADGVALPREIGAAVALPLHTVFSAAHGGATVAVRLLSCSTDGTLPHAERIQRLDKGIEADSGEQPYSLVWRVDSASHSAGCGRVCLMHRSRDPSRTGPVKPHRVAWLWGAGDAEDQGEVEAMQAVLREAAVEERLEPTDGWDESNQPHDSYPAPHPAYSKEIVGECRWTLDVSIRPLAAEGQPLSLSLARTDAYCPWKQHAAYSAPAHGSLHRPPYFVKDLQRRVNGEEALRWEEGEDPFRMSRIDPSQLYEPHRKGGCAQLHANAPPVARGDMRLQ